MRHTVKQAPPVVKAIANIYAYIGFSMTSTMLILMAGFLYSIYNVATLHITQAFGEFIHSIAAAFLYPIIIAVALGLLDAILIIIPAKILDKNTPDYLGILLIRTSSLIAYAVKPSIIALVHGPTTLTIIGIYKLNIIGDTAWISLTVTVVTYILTVIGLMKSGGLGKSTALVSAGVPIIAHLLA